MIRISVLLQEHAGPTGRVLVLKDSDGGYRFPEGYVRVNESEAAAVERLVTEQFSVTAEAGRLLLIGHKKPADGYVEHLYEGNITHNTHTRCDYHCYYAAVRKWPEALSVPAGSELCWVLAEELGALSFAGDDADFLAKYDPWVNGREIPDRRML